MTTKKGKQPVKDYQTENLTLNERVKELKILSLNGVTYLGKSQKDGDMLNVTEAVEIGDIGLEDGIKKWIRQENLDSLESISLEGDYSLGTKSFNTDQIYLIDKVTSEATYKMSRVIKNLENQSF